MALNKTTKGQCVHYNSTEWLRSDISSTGNVSRSANSFGYEIPVNFIPVCNGLLISFCNGISNINMLSQNTDSVITVGAYGDITNYVDLFVNYIDNNRIIS